MKIYNSDYEAVKTVILCANLWSLFKGEYIVTYTWREVYIFPLKILKIYSELSSESIPLFHKIQPCELNIKTIEVFVKVQLV
jgi:hypothetical protein